ncbi:MAG: hypothetical protein PHD56_03725 [Anaerostipes sp.]|nr:hypothetical protein [Anaerostipes sp.]
MHVVLSWNDKPADLDSHLFTPRKSSGNEVKDCHIWFGRKDDSSKNSLDVDDTDGYGPETITIKNAVPENIPGVI